MILDENTKNISVHGREALDLPYARWVYTDTNVLVQQDISHATLYIEIPAANIRKQLVPDQLDGRGLVIYLTREEVAMIPFTPTPYVLLDETRADIPVLELQGKIYRTGYSIQPSPPSGFV